MIIREVKIQRIDIKKIPDDFSFEDTDIKYEDSDDVYFIDFPNDNLKEFVFGDIYNSIKLT